MNREILFRGKRADNKEWIYGYLVNLGYKWIEEDCFKDSDNNGSN